MALDARLMELFKEVRPRCHSTRWALLQARVLLRIEELRERNLIEFQWRRDEDFNPKEYSSGVARYDADFQRRWKRGDYEVKTLVVSMGVGVTEDDASVEDAHAWEMLSWIILPSKFGAARDAQIEEAQLDVAYGLKDFWFYDPDPLVMMANKVQNRFARRL